MQLMILAILRLRPLPDKKKDALEILESICTALRQKHGCMACQVYESYGAADCLLYVEQWASRELFERHVQSDLYLRVLNAMELSQETPLLQFHEAGTFEGIERIQMLRQSGHRPNHGANS
jgi:quinol monooxygenase YgiN